MNFTDEQSERIVVALEKIAGTYEVSTPPYEPTEPSSPTIELTVTADKAVLVEYVRDNDKGYPVFAQPPVSERYVAMKGKVLIAYPEIILADGRRNVYKLTSANVVGGDKLPDDRWEYVRVRDVQ